MTLASQIDILELQGKECQHEYAKWNRSLAHENQLVRVCQSCGEIVERDVVTHPFNPESIGGQREHREIMTLVRSPYS